MAITKLDAVSLRSFYLASTFDGDITRWVRNGKTKTTNGTPDWTIPVHYAEDGNIKGNLTYHVHGKNLFRSHREAKAWLDEQQVWMVNITRRGDET